MIEEVDSMWNGRPGCIDVAKRWIDILHDDVRPTHSTPYQGGPTARVLVDAETAQIITMKVSEPVTNKRAAAIVFYFIKNGSPRFYNHYL